MAARHPSFTDDRGKTPEELQWIDQITRLMDSKFTIPGTSIKFGIDPIIGLIPYFGEVVTFSISGLIVLGMVRHGASGRLVAKMILNLTVDAVTGLVPGLGDLFDVYFKANRRNYKLLKEHQLEGQHQGSAWPLVIGVSVILLIILAAMIWGMVSIAVWAVNLF